MTSADDAFDAWWPSHAVRHNSRSPVAAREAFRAGWDAAHAALIEHVGAEDLRLSEGEIRDLEQRYLADPDGDAGGEEVANG